MRFIVVKKSRDGVRRGKILGGLPKYEENVVRSNNRRSTNTKLRIRN